MKTVIYSITVLMLLTAQSVSAQYLETFSISDRGILAGTCNFTESSCTTDYSGVDWTINGNFSGMDSDDFIATNAAGVLYFVGDIDEEMCFESPVLDISAIATASISVDLTWTGHDSGDYIDVEYQIDGGAWVQVSNQFGGGSGTVDFTTSGNTGSGTVTQAGLTGGTLSIRVCVDTNTNGGTPPTEFTTLDNVNVPETGVTVQELPVTWGELSLKNSDRSNTVYWTTHSETNNQYFEVERSSDGLSWTTLGKVNSTNHTSVSTSMYQYDDNTPLSATSYYRVKQVDFDGRFAYSKLLTSRRAISYLKAVFPNPFTDNLTITFDQDSKPSGHTVTLYDAMGHIVLQQMPHSTSDQLTITTQGLPAGLYFVDNGTSMLKVLKQ